MTMMTTSATEDLATDPCPGCRAAEARALVLGDPAAWVPCEICGAEVQACVGCREAADYLRQTLAAAPKKGARGKAGQLASVMCDLCGEIVALDEIGARRTLAKEESRTRSATARLRREALLRALEHLERWEPEMQPRGVEPVRASNGNVGGGAKITATDRSTRLDAASDADAIRRAYAIRDKLEAIGARGREDTRAQRAAWDFAMSAITNAWPPRPGGAEDRARNRVLARKLGKLRADPLFADEVPSRDALLGESSRRERLFDLGWSLAFLLAHRDALHEIGPPPVSVLERATAVLTFMRRRKLRAGETWALVLGWHFVDDATRRQWEPSAPGKMANEHERSVHAEQIERGLERRKRHGQELLDSAVLAWFGA